MKSGTCGRPARNPAEIEFPLVPTAPGTSGAAAGGRPPPDGAPVPSGFSTAASIVIEARPEIVAQPADESKPHKSHTRVLQPGNAKPYRPLPGCVINPGRDWPRL